MYEHFNPNLPRDGFDGYIFELGRIDNSAVSALDDKKGAIIELIEDWKKDNKIAYMKLRGEGNDVFCQEVGIDYRDYHTPILCILDKKPSEYNQGDNYLIFEVGEMNDSEMTLLIQQLAKHMEKDEFMSDLTWEKRKRIIKNSLDTLIENGVLSLTIKTAI